MRNQQSMPLFVEEKERRDTESKELVVIDQTVKFYEVDQLDKTGQTDESKGEEANKEQMNGTVTYNPITEEVS